MVGRRGSAIMVAVPTVARFRMLAVILYANDHGPPHFHVRGGGVYARVRIHDMEVVGNVGPGLRHAIRQWGSEHRSLLFENWFRVRSGEAPVWIDGEE